MKKDVEYKGTIELGTSVMVSDPGYDMDVSCKYQMNGTKAGTWKCFVFYHIYAADNKRCAKIVIMHSDYEIKPNVLVPNADIGVDSGQAGFFDLDYFKKYCSKITNSKGIRKIVDTNDAWYERICKYTTNGNYASVVDNKGFVSSSGFGDGGYKLYIGKNDNGEIVSAMVVFISNDK